MGVEWSMVIAGRMLNMWATQDCAAPSLYNQWVNYIQYTNGPMDVLALGGGSGWKYMKTGSESELPSSISWSKTNKHLENSSI